jgi:hypothetical protein
MIQRRQTLFILIALLLCLLSLFSPVGTVEGNRLGHDMTIFNLCMKGDGTVCDFSTAWLFGLQALTFPVGLLAVFKYHNRLLQMRLCVANTILLILWYVAFAFVLKFAWPTEFAFHPKFYICLPLIEIILYIMARHSIKADDKLVKAADRIR